MRYVLIIIFFSQSLLASCCSSALASWINILRHERAIVDLSSDINYRYGFFLAKDFSLHRPKGFPYLLNNYQLLIAARLFRYMEPFSSVGIKIQHNDDALDNDIKFTLGSKFILIRGYIDPWPGLSLMLSLDNFKTSSRYNMGLMLSKSFNNIDLGLSYIFAIPSSDHSTRQEGLSHNPSISLGFAFADDHYVSLAWAGLFKSSFYVNNDIINNSDERKLTILLNYKLDLHSHVKIHSGLTFDLPYLGKNTSNEIGINLGMRLGVF